MQKSLSIAKAVLYKTITVHLFLCLWGAEASARSTDGYAPWTGVAFNGIQCSGGEQGYGPYDYLLRDQYKQNLHLVESAHFNASVEQLIAGAKPTHYLEGDLGYTLMAFPNHHRALYTVVRYRMLKGAYKRRDLSPAECYLQRAITFSPKDGTSYMIYGILLHRTDHEQEALDAYRKAQEFSPYDVQIKYNLGLLLFDMGKHEEAKDIAIEVYRGNYPLNGLKSKLTAAGFLQESDLLFDEPAEPK